MASVPIPCAGSLCAVAKASAAQMVRAAARSARGGICRGRTARKLTVMRTERCVMIAMLALVCAGGEARAQRGVGLDLGGAILAGGDEQRYLRTIAMLDSSGQGSVTIQPFGRAAERRWREFAAKAEGPWAGRFSAGPRERAVDVPVLGRVNWALLRGDAQVWYHSDFPAGEAPGVVWAGRGLTTALQWGARVEGRWWRAQVAPVGFVAQNRDFALTPNGQTGRLAYGDARFPLRIDKPQRFGDRPYGRLDWGESFLEVDGYGLSAAVSSERQQWGPAREFPLAISTESGGYPHLRVGTSKPLDIWIGKAQLRLTAGKLGQSAYSPDSVGETSRYLSGAVATFVPRGMEGLEFGVTRLTNGPWDGFSLGLLTKPIAGVINDSGSVGINQTPDNGFASVFVRLAPRGTGFEAYAEMAREDFAGNWRWLALEPDDLVSYVVGVSRTILGGGTLTTVGAELVNSELSHAERAARTLARPLPPYLHHRTRQGLTNVGQLLGSSAAFGGSGGVLSYSRSNPWGRIDVSASRMLRYDWLPANGNFGGVPSGAVEYGMRAAMLVFRGKSEWGIHLQPRYLLNDKLASGRDAFSLELHLSVKGW